MEGDLATLVEELDSVNLIVNQEGALKRKVLERDLNDVKFNRFTIIFAQK